jgi:hypothetical protein
MKWMIPINQLDIVQLNTIDSIVENTDRSHLVRGFAGSGKTIVLTHVVERLAFQRPQLNICFATHTHALKDLVESGLSPNALRSVEISTFDKLRRDRQHFDVVVADELQDLPSRYIDRVEGRYDALVAAADFDQRIHRSSAKVPEIKAMLSGSVEHQLQEIHRINLNVFHVATAVLRTASVHDDATVREDNEQTRVFRASSFNDEVSTMYEEAVRVSAKGLPSAVLLPTRKLLRQFVLHLASENNWGSTPDFDEGPDNSDGPYKSINDFLRRNRAHLQLFGSRSGEMSLSDRQQVVYLLTYHRAKGLDFPNVFLPHLTADTSLEPMMNAKDEEERRMFFVAATRAKERLYLSYHGEPHRFLSEIPSDLTVRFTKQRRTY